MKLFLLVLAMLVSCNNAKIDFQEYIPEKNPIDNSIFPKNLVIYDTIHMEENESVVIQDISSADYREDGKYFAITSPSDRLLVIYDENANIVRYHKASSLLSDSIALSGLDLPEFSFHREWSKYDWYYITIGQLPETGFNIEDTSLFINNMFMNCKFQNKKLYALPLIYIPAINDIQNNRRIFMNTTALFEYNHDFSLYKIHYFNIEDSCSVLAHDFYVEQDGVLMTTEGISEEFISLTKYGYDRNRKETVSNLPKKYIEYNLFYNNLWYPKIRGFNNEYYITYPFDDNVYGLNNEQKFKLINLPFSNDSGFVYFQKYINYRKINQEYRDKNILNRLFPVRIFETFIADNKFCVVYVIVNQQSEVGYSFLLQEYTFQGTLLSQSFFDDDPNNKIKRIAFDEHNGLLSFFRKSQNGWIIQRLLWQ